MPEVTGRCYCGAVSFTGSAPQTVAYCHCSDCKRVTGAAVPAFAAFGPGDLRFDPPLGEGKLFPSGARRWNCKACGSPLAAEFTYLPEQTYVPVGVIDNAEDFPPELHCYAGSAFTWLHQEDGVLRVTDTGSDVLQGSKP